MTKPTAFFDPVDFTFPGECHVAEVEIDSDTGELDLVAYTAVDDVGAVLNPMIVEGKVHGGVVRAVINLASSTRSSRRVAKPKIFLRLGSRQSRAFPLREGCYNRSRSRLRPSIRTSASGAIALIPACSAARFS